MFKYLQYLNIMTSNIFKTICDFFSCSFHIRQFVNNNLAQFWLQFIRRIFLLYQSYDGMTVNGTFDMKNDSSLVHANVIPRHAFIFGGIVPRSRSQEQNSIVDHYTRAHGTIDTNPFDSWRGISSCLAPEFRWFSFHYL